MVINVDHSSSGGTHLVTCYVSKQIEYMDTFGLEPPIEFFSYFVRSKKLGVYNSTQYQNIYSVLCGSFCLYYINERDRGRSAYNTLYTPSNNTLSNENFLRTVWWKVWSAEYCARSGKCRVRSLHNRRLAWVFRRESAQGNARFISIRSEPFRFHFIWQAPQVK